MIVITGATGQLGAAIINNLINRGVAKLGVSVRDPARAAELSARGVRVRQGDFDNPDSLRHAFEGADQLLLVSSNAAATGGDPLAQHQAAIDVASEVGIGRIIYTSHMAASATSAFPPMRDHAATELMLARSGLAWTALRNGFYASSGIMLMGDFLKTGVIAAPQDGKVCWTGHADLAEAAAIILASDGQHDGPTAPLTASEVLDLADLAAIATEITGRAVRREIIADSDLRARMASHSVSPSATEIVLGLYLASRAGEFVTVDPALQQLLGRQPATMRELIARTIAA